MQWWHSLYIDMIVMCVISWHMHSLCIDMSNYIDLLYLSHHNRPHKDAILRVLILWPWSALSPDTSAQYTSTLIITSLVGISLTIIAHIRMAFLVYRNMISWFDQWRVHALHVYIHYASTWITKSISGIYLTIMVHIRMTLLVYWLHGHEARTIDIRIDAFRSRPIKSSMSQHHHAAPPHLTSHPHPQNIPRMWNRTVGVNICC